MTFFFDNCLSYKYAAILIELGEDVVHLRRDFPEGTRDEEWIPDVAARGWTAVTLDAAIRKTPQIREVLLEHELHTYFLPNQIADKPLLQQAAWITRHWEGIRDHALDRSPEDPLLFRVQQNGRIRPEGEVVQKRRKRRKR